MLPQERFERFIGSVPELGYAAFYRGVCIAFFPSYLAAEAALEREALEQAARDEADGEALDAQEWLAAA